ncbi:MAG: valine--tRNA ligase [Clostridiales bacterium]|nr:valine--tRNA ligase [Clostridiales bacterium]
MLKQLPKTYDPEAVEEKIYDMWLKGGYFRGVIDPQKEPFTIVIPPPNVTAQLHIGHACDNTLQDILIRYKRMQGYAALWIPGTDHAGIATQIKVEEKLRNEGKTRHDLGREKFLEEVWAWKEKYGGQIINQLKKLGSSCDWDRERFTMDEGCSKAVREVFVRLYEKGLIYKGSRIVNWCPDCVTALSDIEVEHEEQRSHLWHIKYKVKDSQEYITVATTRPETMLGDTAVAVNPSDERYRHLVGKTLILPLVGREIPLIADEYVDPSFGTGCVKITPAHDPNDFEVGLRHKLPVIRVMDDNAVINEKGGKYQGMGRYEARKAIVNDLRELGQLDKEEGYAHNVGVCYRCGKNVEPVVSAQWFVRMKPLAEKAIAVVKEGDIVFVPERFSKIYINWMENIHDWCISRQLWWGHQIPAWYCDDCGHINVSRDTPEKCEKCGSIALTQDEDVLDTWFSSALWPFSTLGWPDKTPDMDYFYPTSVLVTAYDIIFFWVARMIFSGLEHTNQKPFSTVFIHGLVRDEQGRKMSKSLGNGVDPLDMVEKYGADALRLNLVSGISPGNDMRFIISRCESFRNFANKLWNAARFVLMNLEIDRNELPEKLETEDKWILSRLNSLVGEVTENLDKFELGIAAEKIYDFIWDSYCDWYIELTKTRLQGNEDDKKISAQKVLCYVLTETLKLLHPFMPFITEEIWQSLPHEGEALMVEQWPVYMQELSFPEEEADMESIMKAIKAVRALRAEKNVPPSKKSRLIIVTDKDSIFKHGEAFMMKLAFASEIDITETAPENLEEMAVTVTDDARIFIPMAQLVDIEKELLRIDKELKKSREDLSKVNAKLQNPGFVEKAPEHVVNGEREKAARLEALIENLTESRSQLEKIKS